MDIVISKSNRKDKKLKAVIDNKKTIHFGAKGYEDFTTHKDEERKQRYIERHRKREEKFWNKSGIDTPSFWALFLLWNKPTIKESYADIKKRFL